MSETTINLVIYYNHQKFDVEAMLDDPVETLAAQIESMTQLATKSQTLVVEDDVLVLNRSLRSYNLSPNQIVVVLGTNTIAANPKEKLSDAALQKFEAPQLYPIGIENYGTGCFLISAVQYLFSVKPVRDFILDSQFINVPIERDQPVLQQL